MTCEGASRTGKLREPSTRSRSTLASGNDAASLQQWRLLATGAMVQKGHITPSLLEQSLIELAVDTWKFSRVFARVVNKLDAGEANRYAGQLRYFQKRVEQNLETVGLKIVNVEGHVFDPGMAASPLNIGDFGPEDALLVDQMVEPIIMGRDGLKKQGTVMLRKVEA